MTVRRVPLSDKRLAKLQDQEKQLHATLTSDAGRKLTREMHAQHGVTSPAMEAEKKKATSGPPPIYEGYNSRMPTKHKGKVFFGGKPAGKTLSITKAGSKPTPAKETPMTAPKATAAKSAAPVSKTIDPVAESATRKTTRAAAKKTPVATKSSIGAKARAAANKLKAGQAPAGLEHAESSVQSSRHGAKAPMTDHLQPQQFAGKHHAAPNATSVAKNAKGSMNASSIGRHSYEGKHRGSYNEAEDVRRVALSGSISYGKHSAEGAGKIRGPFEPLRKSA